MSDTWIGKTFGRWQIESEIGRGGMGVVYQARQLSLNRPVAIKVLPAQLARDEQFRERFRQEAQVIATLVHDNILHVYDVEEVEGTYFIVMELIYGQSLRSLRDSRRLGVDEVSSIGIAVARALGCAHAQGIVHRDVKSHNVMVTRDGKVKLMDFGIARVAGTGIKTQTGSVLGTPEYMAPEQARTGESSPRTDLYSLGVLLYELATGRLPFTGHDPFSVAFKHISEAPAPPRSLDPQLPEWLERVILKAMAKAPEERYQSAAALERDLAAQGGSAMAGGAFAAASPAAVVGAAPSAAGAGAAPYLEPATAPTHMLRGFDPGSPTGQTYLPVRVPRSWGPWALATAVVLLAAVGLWVFAGRAKAPAGGPGIQPTPGDRPAGTAGNAVPPVGATGATAADINDPVTSPPTQAKVSSAPPMAEVPPPPPPATPRYAAPAHVSASAAGQPVATPAESPTLGASPAPAPAPAAVAAAPPEPAYSPPAAVSEVLRCREGVKFQTDPEEAIVSIDGQRIGIADDWDGAGGGKAWRASPGTYVACLSGPALRTACVELRLDPGAKAKFCEVETELEEVD